MHEIPSFAPGCFGSALAYGEKIPVCRGCIFAASCQPLHEKNLAKLREHFGITIKQQTKIADKRKIASEGGILSMSLKVQGLLARIDESKIKVTESLKAGVNPFVGSFPFLQIACHLLLRLEEPISQNTLTTALMTKMKWQQDTAKAHTRMAFQALMFIGAVDHSNGSITLRKS
ncbi:MAG: hypothetical protein ACEQSB_00475 [Undibacterium sp.]